MCLVARFNYFESHSISCGLNERRHRFINQALVYRSGCAGTAFWAFRVYPRERGERNELWRKAQL